MNFGWCSKLTKLSIIQEKDKYYTRTQDFGQCIQYLLMDLSWKGQINSEFLIIYRSAVLFKVRYPPSALFQ